MKTTIEAKVVDFDHFSFNPIKFDGFNRVEFEAVAKTQSDSYTATDAARR